MRDDIDAYLAAAFQDVPVPKGLAERLLDRLAADAATGDSIAHQDAYPTRQIASYNRRWLLVGGGLLAVAAGLLIAVWLGPRSETRLSEQMVLNEAIQSFDAGSKDSGRLLSEVAGGVSIEPYGAAHRRNKVAARGGVPRSSGRDLRLFEAGGRPRRAIRGRRGSREIENGTHAAPLDNCWVQLLRIGVAGGPVAVCSCRAR